MDFVAQQASGYENVGFIQKDIYNHFGIERREQVVDGNTKGALAYLCGKAQDPRVEEPCREACLHNNKWIANVYYKRTLWAEAYLHGHFFVGAKSTQCCESMNAFLNRFLKVHPRLFEFVRAYDKALARLCHNEAKAQSETENTTPILSTVDRYEKARDAMTKLTCRIKELYVQHVEGNGTKGKSNIERTCFILVLVILPLQT
ncbi:hypothetical protein ACSBR1_029923 [Camellia fascicularis]